MSQPKLKLTYRAQVENNVAVSHEVEIQEGVASVFEETIPKNSTDLALVIAMDVSALRGLYICSDVNLTIETNSGSAPDNTIALKAGVPLTWTNEGGNAYFACPFTVDVTTIYATNADLTNDATLEIQLSYDPTPAA